MKQEELKDFISHLMHKENQFQMVFSTPRAQGEGHPHKAICRPLEVQKRPLIQLTTHFAQRVQHENVSHEEAVHRIFEQWVPLFQRMVCFTPQDDFHLLISRKGRMTLLRKGATKTFTKVRHNKEKNYHLQEGTAYPFLVELGLMTKEGKVIASKYPKFRQIHRFLEQVRHVLEGFPEKKISIVDFGCGKAYLTFALYHFLKEIQGWEVQFMGVDRKKEVIHSCQELAKKLGYDQLEFTEGDVHAFEPKVPVDMVIALHACDTATDVALEKAIRWEVKAILAVPCCQQELYAQIQQPLLAPLLRHGILKERFASLATDALRAQLLEMAGYETVLIEFVDHQDTPKNIMICAKRKPPSEPSSKKQQEYAALVEWLHVKPFLETRLFSQYTSL